MYNGVNFNELAPQFDQYGECLLPTAVDPNTTARIFSSPVDHDNSGSFNSDEFRMYHYKIKRCPRMRSHDWTNCPYAHRGEKAQRRDPQRFTYAAIACPSFRDGVCYRGDECEFAHGVFEYWLHPARYRTRVCNAGVLCTRKVCFFAHSPSQLRIPPEAAKAFMCCRHHHLGHYDYRAVDNNNKAAPYSADAAAPVEHSAASTGAASSSNAANAFDVDAADRFSELMSTLKLSDEEEVGSSAVNYKSIIHRLPPDGDDLLHIDWVAEFLK